MKRLALYLLLIGYAICASAQAPDETTPTETQAPLHTYYVELVTSSSSVAKSTEVRLEMGRLLAQMIGLGDNEAQRVQQRYTFNSVVDALNLLSMRGWQLVDTYTAGVASKQAIHFVLKMEADSPSAVAKSLMDK